jgi:hypothetical protein
MRPEAVLPSNGSLPHPHPLTLSQRLARRQFCSCKMQNVPHKLQAHYLKYLGSGSLIEHTHRQLPTQSQFTDSSISGPMNDPAGSAAGQAVQSLRSWIKQLPHDGRASGSEKLLQQGFPRLLTFHAEPCPPLGHKNTKLCHTLTRAGRENGMLLSPFRWLRRNNEIVGCDLSERTG